MPRNIFTLKKLKPIIRLDLPVGVTEAPKVRSYVVEASNLGERNLRWAEFATVQAALASLAARPLLSPRSEVVNFIEHA